MKHTFVFLCALLLCMAVVGCSDLTGEVDEPTRTYTSTRPAVEGIEERENPLWFSDVIGKTWYLTELRQTGVVGIVPYQDIQPFEGTLIYTLSFNAEDVSGTGFINFFRGPYTVGNGQALWIKEMAVTLMAPINEPSGLKEDDYFNYLVNTYRWNLAEGNLELQSQGADGKETVLIFAARDPAIIWPDSGDGDPNSPVVHAPVQSN